MTRPAAVRVLLVLALGLLIVGTGWLFLNVFPGNLEQVATANKILTIRENRALPAFSNLPVDGLCTARGTEDEGSITVTRALEESSGCSALQASRLACLEGQPELAVELLLLAESNCSRRELVDEWAGQLAWSAGDREEAIGRWSQQVRTTRIMLTWANEFFRQGDLDNSRYLLEAALPKGATQLPASELGKAYAYLGLIYRQQLDWSSAASAFARAADLMPERWSSWLLLGGAQRNVGDPAAAYESLSRALSLAPSKSTLQVALIHEQIGRTLKDMERYDEAYASALRSFCLLNESPESGAADLRRLGALLSQLSAGTGRGEAQEIGVEACP